MLLTPPGGGAIAVVRLAGQAVVGFLGRYFDRPAVAGRAVYGRLSDGGVEIDDAVVVLGNDERLADLNIHGGPWVVQAILNLTQRHGFALTSHQPGQPLPALAVDAASSLERDILRCLPLASTQLAIETLLAQASAWKALAAAVQPTPGCFCADRALHHLLHPPHLAIIGLPNVGKSTLANQLFAQERCITADMPGTTRDWVGQLADIDGLAIYLMDTPGQRATADAIERQAIIQANQQVRSADLVIIVLDPTQPNEADQRTLINCYPRAILAINKTDQPPCWNATTVGGLDIVATSGRGIAPLRRLILQRFECVDLDPGTARCWLEEQRELVENPVSLKTYCAGREQL